MRAVVAGGLAFALGSGTACGRIGLVTLGARTTFMWCVLGASVLGVVAERFPLVKIARGEETFEVAVLGLSDVRGPAPVAQALYAESDASRAQREAARAQRAAARAGYRPPEGRPDKRARRLIRALGDIDAL